MDVLLWLLAVLAVALAVAVLARSLVHVVTIHDYERGLRFRRGRLEGLVGAGTYLVLRPLGEIRRLDARPTILLVEGQEVPTADGVSPRISLAARYVVGDPVAAITREADYWSTMRLHLQLALRDAVGRRTLDEALASRSALGSEIRDLCADGLATIGLELLEVQVRDVMLPAEIRRAYGAVVAARKAGEADLERVRAETASLRALANAGRLLEDHPGLLQLRILQELGDGSGHTIVFVAPELPGDGTRPGRAPHAPSRRPAGQAGGSDGTTP